jgi:hypothetical protein
MSTIRCQAKDPANCRYHAPNAAANAFAQLKVEEKKLASITDQTEYLEQAYVVEEAREAYESTPDGLISVAMKAEDASRDYGEDSPEAQNMKYRLRVAEYNVEKAEKKAKVDEEAGGPLIPLTPSTYVPAGARAGGDHLWPQTTGNKYEPGMRTQQIAARIRGDIKEAQAKNFLPKHLKYKVNNSGDSLRVTIIGASNAQVIDGYEYSVDNGESFGREETSEAREHKQRVSQIVGAYKNSQYDEIEGRTNYTNYWSTVDYEDDWAKEKREEKERIKELRSKISVGPLN